jgi:Ase1/PRC1/MAP65 family protein
LKEHLNDLQTEKVALKFAFPGCLAAILKLIVFFVQNGRLQKIDIQTNSIHEMCNIMSIDLKMALKDVHPSYAELGGS